MRYWSCKCFSTFAAHKIFLRHRTCVSCFAVRTLAFPFSWIPNRFFHDVHSYLLFVSSRTWTCMSFTPCLPRMNRRTETIWLDLRFPLRVIPHYIFLYSQFHKILLHNIHASVERLMNICIIRLSGLLKINDILRTIFVPIVGSFLY